jgi:hypothetical protein
MTTIHTDDQDTIRIEGTLDERGAIELKRMVTDAYLLREEPLESLTLDFSKLLAIDPGAMEPLRVTMTDVASICAERKTALRVVTGPAMRDLAG